MRDEALHDDCIGYEGEFEVFARGVAGRLLTASTLDDGIKSEAAVEERHVCFSRAFSYRGSVARPVRGATRFS